MEFLERIGQFFAALLGGFERFVTRLFGSSNERQIRRMGYVRKGEEVTIVKDSALDRVNQLEPAMQQKTDADLKELTVQFKRRLADGETLDDLMVEAYAAAREAGRRFLKMRHYDVQILGGIVLHQGKIAEMVTGEGKTLVATLPAYLNALPGRGVHVVTVNDYLARRDQEWMGPLYIGMGLSVGAIQSDMDPLVRKQQYACDITYGTNNEFGFDYLRDNMKPTKELQCQRELNFAIIDEVDNILIDEARTPLIISGPAFDDPAKYAKADRIARALRKDVHFEVKEKEHTCHLTDEGVREAEKLADVESFYTAGNMHWPHLIDNALRAHHLYLRDVNYVVEGDKIVIVDEFTGRKMPGRQWSDGLHQAVEAKEGVRIKEQTQTLATITIQNFFKLYNKLAGMTGTAMTEAAELLKIYKLDVIAIPTNKPLRRINFPDLIYRDEKDKYVAVVNEVRAVHDEGRPILIGTTSIEKSEKLSHMLGRYGIEHSVLNAKYHEREAEIVAQAGRRGAVTIATNMAGRGTDIILGGNPEYMAWQRLKEKYASRLDVPKAEWDALVDAIAAKEKMREEGRAIAELGGLHIIGTERHEARRIDNQLRGRAGRQGDPGSSRFFLSLEDDLMRIFMGEWVRGFLANQLPEGEAIESRMVSRRIEGAQKKVEERNFDRRKHLLEYDEVMDQQRKQVYSYRQQILDGCNTKRLILEMIDAQIDAFVGRFLSPAYGAETFAAWASQRMGVEFDPRDFRNMDAERADEFVRDEAVRQAEQTIRDLIDENLPLDTGDDDQDEEEDRPQRPKRDITDEWNWQALTRAVNTRWGLSYSDRDLKRTGRDELFDELYAHVREAIERTDLSEGRVFLADDFGRKSVCGWARQKFGIEIVPDELVDRSEQEISQLLRDRARQTYLEKEIEFPVTVGLARFMAEKKSARGPAAQPDRDGLLAWANRRFRASLAPDAFKNRTRAEIRESLVECSRRFFPNGELSRELDLLLSKAYTPPKSGNARADGKIPPKALAELAGWAKERLDAELPSEALAALDPEAARDRLIDAYDRRYRPEMREMERALILQVLDTAWKDHLYSMDRLRSAVGLMGYAQVDPKVEYKREGMKVFDDMWRSMQARVTDLVFRMEEADSRFVGSLWRIGQTHHAEAAAATDIARQQQAAIQASQSDKKPEPIRHRGQRVGRNDPCPCGSGKKYKQCCMRSSQVA